MQRIPASARKPPPRPDHRPRPPVSAPIRDVAERPLPGASARWGAVPRALARISRAPPAARASPLLAAPRRAPPRHPARAGWSTAGGGQLTAESGSASDTVTRKCRGVMPPLTLARYWGPAKRARVSPQPVAAGRRAHRGRFRALADVLGSSPGGEACPPAGITTAVGSRRSTGAAARTPHRLPRPK
jgi:hypothetical protein